MLLRSSLILSPGPYGQFYHRANSDIVSSFGIKIAENKESEPDWKGLKRFLSDVRSSSQSSRILLCAISEPLLAARRVLNLPCITNSAVTASCGSDSLTVS